MGKAAGFLLILAGVGTAAYVVPAFDVMEEPRRGGTASFPASSLTTASIAPAPVLVAPPAATAARAIPPVEPIREPLIVARPLVVAEQPPVKVQTASEPIKVASGVPARSDQRLALTKEIQRELRRVGCYAGDIDGEWAGDTRQAMKTFIDRVNATLPIDQPDHILKTLVSGHPGDACGKSCPAGQTAASNGRCMPTQVIAQSQGQRSQGQPMKRPTDRGSVQVPVQARSERTATPRDVVSADPGARAPGTKPAAEAVVSSWAPTVVAASPPVAVPQPRPEARPAELPGRMAVGVGADADSAVAAPAPKAGSRIVIKKREGVAAAAPAPATIPAEAVAPSQPASRQKIAALDPAEPAAESEAAPAVAPPRPSARRQGQPGVYRAPSSPPPRFVGVYVSPPRVYSGYNSYAGRTPFGPSIFKRLDRDGR